MTDKRVKRKNEAMDDGISNKRCGVTNNDTVKVDSIEKELAIQQLQWAMTLNSGMTIHGRRWEDLVPCQETTNEFSRIIIIAVFNIVAEYLEKHETLFALDSVAYTNSEFLIEPNVTILMNEYSLRFLGTEDSNKLYIFIRQIVVCVHNYIRIWIERRCLDP
jgi:hypothetical protein